MSRVDIQFANQVSGHLNKQQNGGIYMSCALTSELRRQYGQCVSIEGSLSGSRRMYNFTRCGSFAAENFYHTMLLAPTPGNVTIILEKDVVELSLSDDRARISEIEGIMARTLTHYRP